MDGAERLSGSKRPSVGGDASAKRRGRKVLEEQKRRTEHVAREFCSTMLEYVRRWEGRSACVAAAKPEPMVLETGEYPASGAAAPGPPQGLVDTDDDALLALFRTARKDSLEMMDTLCDIETWITLHEQKIGTEECFGSLLQEKTKATVSKVRAFVSVPQNYERAYYTSRVNYETTMVKHKYPQSPAMVWIETVHVAWADLEYFYRGLYHKTMVLYKLLSEREDKLRHPKTHAVL